jgi:hypothetical protein
MVDMRDDRDVAKRHDVHRETNGRREAPLPFRFGALIQCFSQLRKGESRRR